MHATITAQQIESALSKGDLGLFMELASAHPNVLRVTQDSLSSLLGGQWSAGHLDDLKKAFARVSPSGGPVFAIPSVGARPGYDLVTESGEAMALMLASSGKVVAMPHRDNVKLVNIGKRLLQDIESADPALQARREAGRRRRERQEHMKALRQPVPADFTAAVQHIAQHARDLAMFREMLSPSMFDLSDRNLTRIGRAAQWFGREEADTLAGQGQVTIFRKVPSGRGYEIESGDWVAIDPGYAEGHSPQNQNVDGEVLSMTVPGEHVFMGVDANEWVYINPVDWGDFASLAEVYEHFSQVRAIEDPCIGTWYEAGVVAKGQGREAMHSLGFFRDEAKAKSVAEDHAKASGFVGLIACFENLPLRVVETLPVCAEVSGSLLQSMADQFAEAVRIDSSDGPGLLRTPRFGIEPETVVLYTGRWGRHYSPDHADNRLLRHNRSEELGR